jgi:hypothetical protein
MGMLVELLWLVHDFVLVMLLLVLLILFLLAVIKYIYLPPIYLHFIQDIEDMCLLLMSSMSFCLFTISGTSDDGKAPYGPKSMHIFNMSKITHSHREYDMRG